MNHPCCTVYNTGHGFCQSGDGHRHPRQAVASLHGDQYQGRYRLREKKKAGMLEKQRARKDEADKEETAEKESLKT